MNEWAFSVCAVGVLTAAIRMITPRMKLGDAVGSVLSLLILTAIMSPALLSYDLGTSLEPMQSWHGGTSERAGDLTAHAVRVSIENEVDNITRKMGIKARGVRIDIDVTGSLYNVSSIVVYLGEEWESRHDEIIARLRESLGQVVYISYSEEDKT